MPLSDKDGKLSNNIHIRREEVNGEICRMFKQELIDAIKPYTTKAVQLPAEARPQQLPEAAVFLVACGAHDDDLLGSVAIIPLSHDSITARGLPSDVKAAEIKRMIVRPEHRQRGLGRKLLERIEDVARNEMGIRLVVLETWHTLDHACDFYQNSRYRRRKVFGLYDAIESQCYEKYLGDEV